MEKGKSFQQMMQTDNQILALGKPNKINSNKNKA